MIPLMSASHTLLSGGLTAPAGSRFGIVVGRFNDFISERLLAAAIDTLRRHDVAESDLTVAWAPGAFELPLAAKRLAASGRVDALIALGCVIRGATPHFDFVAGECAKGLSSVALGLGFALLGISTFNITALMGILSALIIIIAMIAELLMLPGLLLKFDRGDKQ